MNPEILLIGLLGVGACAMLVLWQRLLDRRRPALVASSDDAILAPTEASPWSDVRVRAANLARSSAADGDEPLPN